MSKRHLVRRLITLVIASAVCASFSGIETARAKDAGPPWVFYMISLSTGKLASYGIEPDVGAKLAVAEINARGGIGGRKIDLKIQDAQSDVAQAVALARSDCDAGALLLMGPVLSAMAASVFPATNAMQCTTLAPSPAASNLTTKNRPWTFVLATPAAVITPAGVKALVKAVKPTSAVVVIDTSDAAMNDQGNRSRDELIAQNIKLLETITVAPDQLDYAALATRIASLKPNVIVDSTSAGAGVGVLRALRKLSVTTPVMFTQAVYTPELTNAPAELLEGNYVYTQFFPGSPEPKIQEFVKVYHGVRGPTEIPSQLATQWYDAFYIAKHAFEKCKVTGQAAKLGPERACVRDAIVGLKNFQGVTGMFNMTDEGFPVLPVNLLRFHNGSAVLIK